MLTGRCEKLFQWAFVTCKFIKSVGVPRSTPKEQYDLLVQGMTSESWYLDGLYVMVLSHFFQEQGSLMETVIDRFKLVMTLLLAAFELLSMESLNGMLYASQDGKHSLKAKIILKYMGSLLSGVTGKEPICPLHKSFHDFLLDHSYSGKFHIDTSKIHRKLTITTLGILNSQLLFNICYLESSYMLNSEVPNLADHIQKCIPEHLLYLC